jgi:hypothetical protein
VQHTRIIVTHYGGPDALRVVEEECPEPKNGEVRVRVLAAGVSLPDIMAREGVHPVYISSWVDLEFRRCFQVMEAESEAQLKMWTEHWDDLVEFEIVPVRTSDQAASVIAPQL